MTEHYCTISNIPETQRQDEAILYKDEPKSMLHLLGHTFIHNIYSTEEIAYSREVDERKKKLFRKNIHA